MEDSTQIENINAQPPPEESGPTRPHGCLLASGILFVLIGTGIAGAIWLNTLIIPTASLQGIAAAVYGLGLLIPFGLLALLLRDGQWGLWRGVALALSLFGLQALLTGGLTALDLALTFPGAPAVLMPVVTAILAVAVLFAARKRIKAPVKAGPLFFSAALGLLTSGAWVLLGALGTPTEALLSLLDVFSMAFFLMVALSSIFFFDEPFMAQYPGWAIFLTGGIFAAVLPGWLAARGYWLHGGLMTLALILGGITAGVLLVQDRRTEPRRSPLPLFVFLLMMLLLPFGWTEGFEGDWMMEDALSPWGTAAILTLVASFCVGIAALILRKWAFKPGRPIALPAIVLSVTVVLVIITSLLSGNPGLQPETFFVIMADQADTGFAQEIEGHTERYTAVYETLTEQAAGNQADLRAFLNRTSVRYTPYYLVNGIEVETYNPFLRLTIAHREDVARVLNSPHTRPVSTYFAPVDTWYASSHDPGSLTWGVDEIDAEVVWEEFATTGESVIIGHADSGVDWVHPALQAQYMGSTSSHDYTWFDPWFGTTEPTDTSGHGTHTLGSILGSDGIGVAPDAEWIACRNLGRNLGNPAYYLDCMQFLFAPHPQDGDPFTEGDPARGAHITSNSWGCPPEEGCDDRTLAIAVEHLRDAGQVFVASAGNEGPGCSTVWAPASADASLSVGASGPGAIAEFSSRGPVLSDGSGRVKPDITAPGVGILSSIPGGRYGHADGTSMAGPHVAGVVALIWSANPDLIGDIDATEEIIFSTSHYVAAPDLCGAGDGSLNNVYGYGIIDAAEAVEAALNLP